MDCIRILLDPNQAASSLGHPFGATEQRHTSMLMYRTWSLPVHCLGSHCRTVNDRLPQQCCYRPDFSPAHFAFQYAQYAPELQTLFVNFNHVLVLHSSVLPAADFLRRFAIGQGAFTRAQPPGYQALNGARGQGPVGGLPLPGKDHGLRRRTGAPAPRRALSPVSVIKLIASGGSSMTPDGSALIALIVLSALKRRPGSFP